MQGKSSRRTFLATGMVVPATAFASLSRHEPARPDPQAALPAAAPKLTYRTLGRTGLKVTTVGFGCMVTSDGSVIEKAADLGINYFDSARGYGGGNNERMVGAALKARRKQLHISTKSHGGSKQALLSDLETSLRELGTDFVDIWYLHGVGSGAGLKDDLLEALVQAKKDGKARFTGFSAHSGHEDVIPAAIAKKDVIDVILASFNFSMDSKVETLLASAAAAGIGIVAMKVMAGGFRRRRAGSKVQETLGRPGAMLAALKWVIRNPNVHTTIPSITDMEQLDENLRAMREPFGEEDQKLLAAQLDYIRPLYCRTCGRCEGTCAKGLPVSDVLRFLSYADGYGEFSLGREHFLALPRDIRTVRCEDCDLCTVRCPNGVRVAERLARAQELFA